MSVSISEEVHLLMNRWLGIAVVALAIVVLLGYQFRATGSDETRPAVGYRAPDFELTGLNGETIRLSDYRGKVVFLNFWATWCGPCDVEMPEIARLKEKYDESDLAIIGINLAHTEDSPDDVAEYMNSHGYDWTVALDYGDVTISYSAIQIPESFFIDPDGIIRAKHRGPMTLSMMEDMVKRAMRGA